MVPHAVSVSLPRWQDNVDYEEGRLTNIMQTGYPRFFIHRSIQKLAKALLAKFGQSGSGEVEGEDCILVPSKRVADSCRSFMQDQYERQGKGPISVRSVQVCVVIPNKVPEEEGTTSMSSSTSSLQQDCSSPGDKLSIYVVLFPKSAFPLAKTFWQHTGDGISSRLADACLDLLEQSGKLGEAIGQSTRQDSVVDQNNGRSQSSNGGAIATTSSRGYGRNRHYARGHSSMSTQTSHVSLPARNESKDADVLSADHTAYLEERYGRNMARFDAPVAKRALRKRIAGVASDDVLSALQAPLVEGTHPDVANRNSDVVDEKDVFLYPTGMSAIFHAHQLVLAARNEKSVCFGFPYLDTLKILEKWGPGCFFLGHGDEDDLEHLESLLSSGQQIASLFCEFPSNPLLRSPDLRRLRNLADKYDFIIVVDETVGNFVNVQVLQHADIVVSSLTKIFTGEANGMGGCLVLNSQSRHYSTLQALQEEQFEDNFFDQNAIFLERNSRDFVQRVHRINKNASALVDRLCQARDNVHSKTIKQVYYPTICSRQNYDACRRPEGGYGGLFSLTFHSIHAAVAFYDALKCAKGPSLGTNFTLASPFVILAHYSELDWAAQFGVESNLVRVSVGLEDEQDLFAMFDAALEAAQTNDS